MQHKHFIPVITCKQSDYVSIAIKETNSFHIRMTWLMKINEKALHFSRQSISNGV